MVAIATEVALEPLSFTTEKVKLRRYTNTRYAADDRAFEMHSDEFNGRTTDDIYCEKFDDCVSDPSNPVDPDLPNKRPDISRTLTIDEAIEENKAAREYLGVHWWLDQEAGSDLGKAVAQSVSANFPTQAA